MIYTLTLNPSLDRELTVKQFIFDQVLRAQNTRLDWGGKGFNVSRCLARLGQKSIAVGFIGGKTGEILAEGLDEIGVETDFVRIDSESRTNISIVTDPPEQYLKVNEPGPIIHADECEALVAKVCELAAPSDLWVFSGSLPPGVPDTIYQSLIKEVQDRGAKVFLDSSGEPLSAGCLSGPYGVKPNIEEVEALTGLSVNVPKEAVTAAGQILAFGVQQVLISMGSDGAVYRNGEIAFLAIPPTIQERNSVGAGDAFLAGYLFAILQGMSPADTLRFGVASGSAAASLPGTEMGVRALIDKLYHDTEVVVLEVE